MTEPLNPKKRVPIFCTDISEKLHLLLQKCNISMKLSICNQIYFPFTHKREKKNGFIPSFPTVYRQKNYTYCLFPHLSIYPLGRSLLC